MVVRPNRFEWCVYVTTMFLLAFGQPRDWTSFTHRAVGPSIGVPADPWPITVWLLGAVVFALASCGFDLRVLRRCIHAEPLLAAVLGWGVLSTLWSEDTDLTKQLSIMLVLTATIGAVMATRFSLRDILAMVGVAMALGTALQFAFVLFVARHGVSPIGWTGVSGHRNNLGHVAVLACLVFGFCIRLFPRFRLVNLALLGANIALILGTNSKTSLVSVFALPAMLLVYWMFRARRTLFGAVWIAMAAAATVLTFTAVRDITPFATAVGRDPRLSQRLDVWASSVDLFGAAPILGNGLGATWNGWFSPARAVWMDVGIEASHAHNGLLQIALDLGAVGAVLLLGVFVRLVVRSVRLIRAAPRVLGFFPLAYATYALLYSITEVGIVGRNIDFLLFAVVVIEASALRRTRSESLVVHATSSPMRPAFTTRPATALR
jgi:exopolysaccharide production protein ExoQ